jgi:hypothetical protein
MEQSISRAPIRRSAAFTPGVESKVLCYRRGLLLGAHALASNASKDKLTNPNFCLEVAPPSEDLAIGIPQFAHLSSEPPGTVSGRADNGW